MCLQKCCILIFFLSHVNWSIFILFSRKKKNWNRSDIVCDMKSLKWIEWNHSCLYSNCSLQSIQIKLLSKSKRTFLRSITMEFITNYYCSCGFVIYSYQAPKTKICHQCHREMIIFCALRVRKIIEKLIKWIHFKTLKLDPISSEIQRTVHPNGWVEWNWSSIIYQQSKKRKRMLIQTSNNRNLLKNSVFCIWNEKWNKICEMQ